MTQIKEAWVAVNTQLWGPGREDRIDMLSLAPKRNGRYGAKSRETLPGKLPGRIIGGWGQKGQATRDG